MLGFSIAILFACSAAPSSATQLHTCNRVIDGDTVVLDGIGTVRLIGVDTAEGIQSGEGKAAADFLRGLVEGSSVRVEYDYQRKDKYDRTLAYLYLGSGIAVNEAIIESGHSRAYTRFPFKYKERFLELERVASEKKVGIWGAKGSTHLSTGADQSGDVTVYVTRTGSKYHREGCRYLARSTIPIALGEAVRAYGPCSVCRPPVLSSVADQSVSPQIQSSPGANTPSTVLSRCQAITKKGTQCKRSASPGSIYCWQHGG